MILLAAKTSNFVTMFIGYSCVSGIRRVRVLACFLMCP